MLCTRNHCAFGQITSNILFCRMKCMHFRKNGRHVSNILVSLYIRNFAVKITDGTTQTIWIFILIVIPNFKYSSYFQCGVQYRWIGCIIFTSIAKMIQFPYGNRLHFQFKADGFLDHTIINTYTYVYTSIWCEQWPIPFVIIRWLNTEYLLLTLAAYLFMIK